MTGEFIAFGTSPKKQEHRDLNSNTRKLLVLCAGERNLLRYSVLSKTAIFPQRGGR